MPTRNAIVIAVDGLRASALGAYGNTWHPTPALDALASQSLVLDWMTCDSPSLEGFYRATWQAPNPPPSKVAEAPRRRGARGGMFDDSIITALTTDERWTAEHAETAGFNEVQLIEIDSDQSATTIADTQMAQLFAVALDELASWAGAHDAASQSRLLWLHARSFHGTWDAPLELRQSLLDKDDPPAPTFVKPPATVAVEDHDELLRYRAAYAAQTIVLDECVGALVAALDEYGLDRNTLVVLVGVRGYALGEHGHVGGEVRSLYSELLHVPCFVRAPGAHPSRRSPQLAQPVDVHATLLDWFGIASPPSAPRAISLLSIEPAVADQQARQYAIASGENGELVLRTPIWMLRLKPGESGALETAASPAVELYVKPDDRWEANEVADRCPGIADRLLAVLDRTAIDVLSPHADPGPPLDADLITRAW